MYGCLDIRAKERALLTALSAVILTDKRPHTKEDEASEDARKAIFSVA